MALHSRLSSIGLTLFAMALEALMTITMPISFGKKEWKQ
jgi:hypothetical protein